MKLNSLFAAMALVGSVSAMALEGTFGDAEAPSTDRQAKRVVVAVAPSATARAADEVFPKVRISGGDWIVAGKSHSLTGWASDNAGVSRVVWHNTRNAQIGQATLSGNGTVASWTIDKIPVVAGENLIYVAVFDAAGNKTRIETKITTTAPTPPTSGLSTACRGFYAPTFALNSSLGIDPIPPLSKPRKGVAVAEPSYGTCLVRATDHVADGASGFARNDYSRRQAFNADNTKYLANSLNGVWHLYDVNTRSRVKQLAGLSGDAEAQWSDSNPDKLYYLPNKGMGMKIYELTVSTNTTQVIADLATRLKAEWPGANAASTRSEGSPSRDGRYWCLQVEDANWKTLGVVTWDRDTDTLLGAMNTNGDRPDHVSMSPSGNYCVVSGDGPRGTVAYSRNFSTSRKLHHKSEHSDIAIDANGDDVYVSVNIQSNAGDVFMVNLRTGARTTLFSTYVAGSATALHVSGKSFNKPGWVLLSTYADYGGRQWLHRKLFAVQLSAAPKIYNLGFNRTAYNDYWTEPHATVNLDFTKILFNSNWGSGSATDVDAYTIEIPADALSPTVSTQRTMSSPMPARLGSGL